MNKVALLSFSLIALIATSFCLAMSPSSKTTSSIVDEKHKPIMIKFFKTVYDKNDLDQFINLMNGLSIEELEALWPDIINLLVVGMKPDDALITKNRTFYKAMKQHMEMLESPLHKAVRSGSLEKVRSLITPQTINSKNLGGESPLFVTLSNSVKKDNIPALKLQYDIAELLLRSGANPCIATTGGLTPLGVSQSPLIAQLLIRFGSAGCINKQDIRGNTALNNAISYYKQYDKALFLIASGANVNAKNQYGYTALHLAAHNDLEDIEQSMNLIQKLLTAGARIDAQTNEGNTPLHIAVEIKEPLLVGLLLQKNANVDIKNNDGYSARDAILKTWHVSPKEFVENYKKPNFKKLVVERSFALPEPVAKRNIKAPQLTSKKSTKKKLTYNQRQEKKALESQTIAATPPSPEITQNASTNAPLAEQPFTKETLINITQQLQRQEAGTAYAQRLLDWWNDEWLAKEKLKNKEAGLYEYWKFMQGRVYHRLPETVIHTILKYGKQSQRPNKTYKDFMDTVYTMKGEIQFENLTNPWNPGKLSQPGYYHVTKGKYDQIYHIGFKATQENTRKLSDFMQGQEIPVEWISKETPNYIAIYDKGESVRHILYLED